MARLIEGGENIGLRQFLVDTSTRCSAPPCALRRQVRRPQGCGEFSFHHYELPDDHPARQNGELHDYVTLGADDVLRCASWADYVVP